jgi:MFS family permease
MFSRISNIYHEYPSKFWMVVGVMFVDRVGGTMLFPFFSLYITQKFGVGMTQAGIILGFFSIFSMLGSMIGGALTDKFGRRSLILFGLVFSALSTLTLGLVNAFWMLYPLAVLTGLLSDVAGPANQAMIADLLPEKQRAEGFGILRVVGNMAWILGPTMGGLIANSSYFYLFISDAVVSCIVAALYAHSGDQARSAAWGRRAERTRSLRGLWESPQRPGLRCLHCGRYAHVAGLPADVQHALGLSA